MEERWKSVNGYEGLYEISNFGNVKSLKRTVVDCRGFNKTISEKVLKHRRHNHGYRYITLCRPGDYHNKLVHRLIAEHFIENPQNKPHINHINGNKADNRLENLEWCTQSENNQHAVDTGLISRTGEKNGRAKLTPEAVKYIKEKYQWHGYWNQERLADKFGVTATTIGGVVLGKTWTHIKD